MRLDVALFGLRLFKSRTQAAEAVAKGRVWLNRQPSRPGHGVKVGDRITLLGPPKERTLEILVLPRGSLRKGDARRLIREVEGPAHPE